MYEYIDSDSLSATEKIRYLITDMVELRGVIGMLQDEAQNEQTQSLLERADDKVRKVMDDLEAAAEAEESQEDWDEEDDEDDDDEEDDEEDEEDD